MFSGKLLQFGPWMQALKSYIRFSLNLKQYGYKRTPVGGSVGETSATNVVHRVRAMIWAPSSTM
jgi:hypothetical protein